MTAKDHALMLRFYQETGIGALKSTEAFAQFEKWKRQQRKKKRA